MPLDRRLFEGKIISSKIYPGFFPLMPTDDVINFGAGLGPQAVVYKGNFKRMVGIDLNEDRLRDSKILLSEHGVTGYETLCEPVERTSLPSGAFDKALALDIIEHLPDPLAFLTEARRVLRPGGRLLVSVPAMHDHFTHSVKALAKMLGRRVQSLPSGHLDAHNSSHSVGGWIALTKEASFTLVKTRASTLWPPLHLYGLPRFWFTNPIIHSIDNALCSVAGLKRLGQAYLMVLEK